MKKRAFIFVILAGVLWGTSGIFVHYLAPLGFTSVQMSAMRSGVSAIALIGYALVADRSLFRISGRELLLFLLSGISLFGTGSAYYASLQLTSISTAVVLMYMAPVYVMLWSVAFFGERMTKTKAISVALMVVGCALVSGVAGGVILHPLGLFLGFLSGVSYGSYNVITKILARRGVEPLRSALFTFIFTAVIAISLCSPLDFAEKTAASPSAAIPLIISIGLVTFVAPYVCYTHAMTVLDAGMTASLGIVEPLSATLFGVVCFSEKLDLSSIIGALMILVCVVMLGRTEKAAPSES